MADPGSVTGLLLAWGKGDEAAFERMVPLVERELHRIAKRCMAGERAGHSLQATALVNEACLRLVDVQHVKWQDRAFSGDVHPADAAHSRGLGAFEAVPEAAAKEGPGSGDRDPRILKLQCPTAAGLG